MGSWYVVGIVEEFFGLVGRVSRSTFGMHFPMSVGVRGMCERWVEMIQCDTQNNSSSVYDGYGTLEFAR